MVPLSAEPVLVRDALPDEAPRRLRTCNDPLPSLGPEPSPSDARLGLRELRASASAQPTEAGLRALRARVPDATAGDGRAPEPPRLWIFDLRQESHGFVDGLPISFYAPRNWGNLGRSRAGALQDEARRLEALQDEVRRHGAVRFPGHGRDIRPDRAVSDSGEQDDPQLVPVRHGVRSEREVVEALSLGYVRLLVTDHQGATEEELARFEAAVRALPPGAWVHFHCRGGKGRASTFLLLYDILRNAERPPHLRQGLSALLLRQRLLSGYGVDELSGSGDWKRPYQEERLLQVRACYERWTAGRATPR